MTIEERKSYDREYQRNWQKNKLATDPLYRAKAKARKKKYRESAKGKATEKAYADKYEIKPDSVKRNKEYSFQRHHGVSVQEAVKMVEEQHGLCDICGKPPTGKVNCSRLHVDHNHKTGEIRRMLCHGCNTALGLVKENTQTLKAMITYLEAHK